MYVQKISSNTYILLIDKTIYEKNEVVQPKRICFNQIVTMSEYTPLVQEVYHGARIARDMMQHSQFYKLYSC